MRTRAGVWVLSVSLMGVIATGCSEESNSDQGGGGEGSGGIAGDGLGGASMGSSGQAGAMVNGAGGAEPAGAAGAGTGGDEPGGAASDPGGSAGSSRGGALSGGIAGTPAGGAAQGGAAGVRAGGAAGMPSGGASAAGGAGLGGTASGGASGSAGAGTAGCVDVDRDGACAADDCDDESAAVGPSQTEVCGNGLDDDCNGNVDEGCLGASAFYVDRDSLGGACDDANPGTLAEPWCTIAEANGRLNAGDTVYIRAGTYVDETIAPANSGTSDTARITYVNYADEAVTLEGSVYCIRLQNTAYVSVRGLDFFNCGRNAYIDGSDHNNIGFCTFDNPAGPETWAGSRIYNGSQYNRVHDCTFSRYGNESGTDPDWDDNGCILDIGNDNQEDPSDFNVVMNSTFYYGGHHILGVYANRNVVRGNTFHNEEWFDCHRPEIGGSCGGRDVITNASQPDLNTHNVFEDNLIAYAGVPPDQVSSTGLSLRTQHNVVRRNGFYSSDSSGVTLSADGGNQNDASYNHIYHNVFYRNGYLLFDDWDPRKYGLMLARWVDDGEHNAMVGVTIQNNVFFENNLGAIYFYYVNETDQVVADNWLEEGDPGLLAATGDPDPFDFTTLDFHLAAGSPCIDNAGFLTQTANSGQSSTTLEVADAGYFFDGYGIVEADLIQLEGQTQAVGIAAVDYDTDTITLVEPLTWAAGDGVGLPFHGSQPDQGMYESWE